MYKNLSLGLDIGTNSVGWCVVDENNEVVKKDNFAMWGVRLFEEASDAKDRRTNRESRRRNARRKERIKILRQLFASEIVCKDPNFFTRLDDSFFKYEDKKLKNNYIFFNDDYNDKDFFNKYPTIFHLRKDLMECKEKFDIRMVYLAIHHIIKYRGNFLYPGDLFNKKDTNIINNIFDSINECLQEYIEQNEDDESYFQVIDTSSNNFYQNLELIMTGYKTINDKKRSLHQLFNVDKKTLVSECIIPLISGSNVDLSKLTFIKDDNIEKIKVCINDECYIEQIEDAKTKVGRLENFINKMVLLKELVDHYYLLKILGDSNSISEAMIMVYDNHKNDLKELKKLIKTYVPDKYNLMFKDTSNKLNGVNYPKYIGINNTNGKMTRTGHGKQEEFYKFVRLILDEIKDDSVKEQINNIKSRMDDFSYFPRQNSDKNGSLPMQLNLYELKVILNNQSKYYPFLNEIEDGFSIVDKIVSLFKFKIPYYVGPLNRSSKYSWIERTNEKIYPWNFEKIVNLDESAKRFIERMQSKCTYLKGEDDYCLPKKSLLFSEYICLQYVNKLTINGSPISLELKKDIFENVFLKIKKPTKKDIKSYLIVNNNYTGKDDFPEVTFDMSSYIKFKNIFGMEFENNRELIENIIKDITVFEDKKILEKRLKSIYNLDDDKVKQIKDLNYKGYGRLSKRLLDGLIATDEKTGEVFGTIIQILRETNLNLQQILFDEKYGFQKLIDDYNKKNMNDDKETAIDFIENKIYTSPLMKRPLVQAYKIIDEVEKILGQPIDKYYVECSRINRKDGQKKSRYEKVKELYKNCKKIALEYQINLRSLEESLNKNKDNLNSDKIYLYFTQLGKCMYSLENLDFDKIVSNNNDYDIDHIYPQALIKDDSFSNRVLVKKGINNTKKDKFIFDVPGLLNPKAYSFYEKLKDLDLISKEKYRRLTKKEISSDELNGFVNRQIVITDQAVVGLIDVLKLYKKVEPTNIIYSKASIISDFRKDYNLPKSRIANNYHHAHDAYLNVVVGRAVDLYYKYNRFNNYQDYLRIQNENISINPQVILKINRQFKGREYWNLEKTLKLLNHNLYERYDIHITFRTYCPNEMFSKITILPAGSGTVPVKSNDIRLTNLDKYGGITSNSFCKYVIIKAEIKGKTKYIMEAIPRMYLLKEEKYLKTLYDKFEIINNEIRSNVLIKDKKLLFCVTGKTGNSYLIKNAKDRYFDKKTISIIKLLEKYNKNKINQVKMYETEKDITISIARNNNCSSVILSDNDLDYLYTKIYEMYHKDIYQFSNITNISNYMPQNLSNFSFKEKITIVLELLKLLKVNERNSCDLSLINGSKNSGILVFNKTLQSGIKIIHESITGYYKKVLFEVPNIGV